MKCIAAVVMMAFVAATQASVAPLALPYAAWASPYGALPYAAAWNPAAINQYSSIPASSAIIAAAAPAPFAYRAALPYAAYPYAGYAAPYAAAYIPGEARYTAINRGALHDAPLPGHSLSQTSINLAPAPGTL